MLGLTVSGGAHSKITEITTIPIDEFGITNGHILIMLNYQKSGERIFDDGSILKIRERINYRQLTEIGNFTEILYNPKYRKNLPNMMYPLGSLMNVNIVITTNTTNEYICNVLYDGKSNQVLPPSTDN